MQLTAEYVRECLLYFPSTGNFRWRERPREHFVSNRGWAIWNSRHAGKLAGGTTCKAGYRQIAIAKRNYYAHRLAYLYMTGEWPNCQIDHRGGRDDNRWSQIRPASASENRCNQGVSARNTTGFKGVSHYRARNKFVAAIQKNGKVYHLGYFDNAEEAYAAYCRSAKKHHGEFARVK